MNFAKQTRVLTISFNTPDVSCERPKSVFGVPEHFLECLLSVQTRNVEKEKDALDLSVGHVSGECRCPKIV